MDFHGVAWTNKYGKRTGKSVSKAITSAQKRKDTSMVYRGDLLDLKWIPEDSSSLKLECLKLIDMKLYMIPQQIFSIQSLKQLDLSQNGLFSIRGIGSLVNLTDIDLSGNRLEYLPDEICSLTSLAFLNVSKNFLTNRSIPQELFERQFHEIDLSENQLVKISSELLQCLVRSESVTIHSNPWENTELAKLTAESPEDSVKQMLQSMIPPVPSKRSSVPGLKKSPSNSNSLAEIEPMKQTPPTTAKPPVVRPRGEAHKEDPSPLREEIHSAASENSKQPAVTPKTADIVENPQEDQAGNKQPPPLKPKPSVKDVEEDHSPSAKPVAIKSKSEVVMGTKEKEHEAAKDLPRKSANGEEDHHHEAANNVSDLSKKIGMSIPTNPFANRGRSESSANSVPSTPQEEPKVEGFPAAETQETKSSGSGGLGSMFKNFSSKMRGNTNAQKPNGLDSPTHLDKSQAPERTAAPLKAMTRAAGPKGRKAANVDQLAEVRDSATSHSPSPAKKLASPHHASETPAIIVGDVRISVVRENEMSTMLEKCADSPPPSINMASKPRKMSNLSGGMESKDTEKSGDGESQDSSSFPRKVSDSKRKEHPIKEEPIVENKPHKEPPMPGRANQLPQSEQGKQAKIDIAELKRKQNGETSKDEPKPPAAVPKIESASAKKLAAFAPKEPITAAKPEPPVSQKSAAEPPVTAKPSRTAMAAAAVGDVLNANLTAGPKKPPPGGVAMFDMGAMKKPAIEEPEEEEVISPRPVGHRKEPSGIPTGGVRMVMPDLANHKLKSVGMLDGPEAGEKQDSEKNNGKALDPTSPPPTAAKPSLKPEVPPPRGTAKGPPIASKPSFSQAKPSPASAIPRGETVKEEEQSEKIPPWKAELEKRKNFQPAT